MEGGLPNVNGDRAGAVGHASRINSSVSGGNSMHSNEATLPEASSGSHGASDQVNADCKSPAAAACSLCHRRDALLVLLDVSWVGLLLGRVRVSCS